MPESFFGRWALGVGRWTFAPPLPLNMETLVTILYFIGIGLCVLAVALAAIIMFAFVLSIIADAFGSKKDEP